MPRSSRSTGGALWFKLNRQSGNVFLAAVFAINALMVGAIVTKRMELNGEGGKVVVPSTRDASIPSLDPNGLSQSFSVPPDLAD